MRVLTAVKFIILYALFDSATGTKSCCREFRTRGYITKYADGLKRTDLEVKYGKTPVKCGGTVSFLSGTRKAPTLKIDLPVDKCRNVTVIALGPEAPLNPPFLHWLVQNIPTVALRKGWTNGGNAIDKLKGNDQGDVKASYVAPKAPKEDLGIGNTTMIIFVYCQCRYIPDIKPFQRTDRTGRSFDVKSYTAKHGLKCPVAGLFHQTSVTGLKLVPKIGNIPSLNSSVGPGDITPSTPEPLEPPVTV